MVPVVVLLIVVVPLVAAPVEVPVVVLPLVLLAEKRSLYNVQRSLEENASKCYCQMSYKATFISYSHKVFTIFV